MSDDGEKKEFYESSEQEIEAVANKIEDLSLTLKNLADKGDLNARCFHDILIIAYHCIQHDKLLQARNTIVEFYQKEIVHSGQETEEMDVVLN
jgi:hypothetical protein